MNVLKLTTRRTILGALFLLSVLLAACGPAPLGVDWAALSKIGAEQHIMLAYGTELLLVDPTSGQPLTLRNADGEPLLDDQGNPRIWQVKGSDLGNAQFYSAPITTDSNTLLVSDYTSRLIEVDLPRARVVNPSVQTLQGHVVADLEADNGLLLVAMSAHDLVALDTQNWTERWRFPTNSGVWAKPLIVGDALYFTSLDHFLYAANVQTGEELWRLDLEGAAVSTPVYQDGHLYVGSFARKIFDISTDGQIEAQYDTHGWVWSAPTLVNGVLYAADLDGWVYALDTSGLREIWSHQLAPSAIRPAPLVVGDTIIVATRDDRLHWLNRSDGTYQTEIGQDSDTPVERIRPVKGQVFADLLSIEPGEGVDLTEPIVVASTMSPDQMLVAFSVSTGQRLWSYPPSQ